MTPDDSPLAGRVALVAGATRGCGRAIAIELGALGATVYGSGRCTRAGRSVDGPARRPSRRPPSASPPRAARASPCAAITSTPGQVAALVDASAPTTAGSTCSSTTSGAATLRQLGQGDLGAPAGRDADDHAQRDRDAPDHEPPRDPADARERRHGLVVEVGDGKGDVPYRTNMPYDLVKTSVVRLGEALAAELRAARRHRLERHARVPALGVDARASTA